MTSLANTERKNHSQNAGPRVHETPDPTNPPADPLTGRRSPTGATNRCPRTTSTAKPAAPAKPTRSSSGKQRGIWSYPSWLFILDLPRRVGVGRRHTRVAGPPNRFIHRDIGGH
jgi:hypothetical protein